MNRFVRFIFFIIILAAVATLTIVLAGNYVSQRAQQAQLAAQHDQTVRHYHRLLDAPCQAYLAVEWQKTGPFAKVLETSILIQPYSVDAARKPIPLPIARLLIAGNSVTVEGLAVSFDDTFSNTFDFARGKTLYLLADVYDTQRAATRARAFIIPHRIPDATRVDMLRATEDERALWLFLGDALQAYFERDDASLAQRLGVTFSPAKPDTKILANGTLYKIFYDANALTIALSSDSEIYSRIRTEAAKLP